MLKRLRIQNFKGWIDTGDIDLAPITVLFGSNSSGKSSIGQFLVMLKQSVQQQDRRTVFLLSGEQASVNLGTPEDIFYFHNTDNDISFDYLWNMGEKNSFSISGEKKTYDTLRFSGRVGVQNEKAPYLNVKKFLYQLYKGDVKQLSVGMKQENKGRQSDGKYVLLNEGIELKRNRGRAWKLSDPIKFYGFPDTAMAYYQDSDFLQDLSLQQEVLFSHFFYLGPLRSKSKRIYSWTGANPESVGDDGSLVIQSILSARHLGRKLQFKPGGKNMEFEEVIGKALKKMELVEDYRIKQIENRQDYEVKVKIKGTGNYVSLPDVGFGVSQVLPVVVQLFYAPDDSIIFIEQPEIHLHPKAQSLLADIIVDAVNMREKAKRKRLQLIIETHSEYLLRRLQMRVSDETLAINELKAYFIVNRNRHSELNKLNVDSYGNILNWPEGFFGDMEEDMYKQAMNALKRRMQEETDNG